MIWTALVIMTSVPQGKGAHCFACHSSVDSLKKYAVEEPPPPKNEKVESCGGPPPPLKKYQKLRVSASFLSTPMGQLGCVECHKGQDIPGMDAMQGIVHDPTDIKDPSQMVCTQCHDTIAQNYSKSLHFTLHGKVVRLEARTGQKGITEDGCLRDVFHDVDCMSCHASCGDCHVSRPKPMKGGLLSAHDFLKTPPMDVCQGCHMARTFGEYTGNFNQPADVHWAKGLMECTACHTGHDLHGDGQLASSMHTYSRGPRCDSCHADVLNKGVQHQIHIGKVSCWTCHAIKTRNCYQCHLCFDEAGDFYRGADSSVMRFKIGYNYYRDEKHPWKYTTLRHPANYPGTFDYWCKGVEKDFGALPNWNPVSAHTVQRITPQNEKCENCHGNDELFLTQADLADYEIQANQPVINAFKTVFPLKRFGWMAIVEKLLLPLMLVGLIAHGIASWTGKFIAHRRK